MFLIFFCMSSYAGVKEAKEAYKNHNYEAAFKEFLILANAGDANAQFIVAYMYSIGEGVPSNIQQAVKWYVNAANNGDVDAQLALGKMYYLGGLVAKDKKEAFFWYYKAANKGSVYAQSQIGNMYRNGEGVGKNVQESIFWLRQAANNGDSTAQFNLGTDYCVRNKNYPNNFVACYALLSLSTKDDTSGMSSAALDTYSKEMTESEVINGKNLALEMLKPGNFLKALDRTIGVGINAENKKDR